MKRIVIRYLGVVISCSKTGTNGVYHKKWTAKLIFPSLQYESVFKEKMGLS